jgi:hypothetical protein
MPAPNFYSNLVQVTRSPWDVTLHFLQAKTPRGAKKGEAIDVLSNAELVAEVTLPLEVGRRLIDVLRSVTAQDAIRVVEESADHAT